MMSAKCWNRCISLCIVLLEGEGQVWCFNQYRDSQELRRALLMLFIPWSKYTWIGINMEPHAKPGVMFSGMTKDLLEEEDELLLSSLSSQHEKHLLPQEDFSKYVGNEIQVLEVEEDQVFRDFDQSDKKKGIKVLDATNLTLSQVYNRMNQIAYGGKLPKLFMCHVIPFLTKNVVKVKPDGRLGLLLRPQKTKIDECQQLYGLMGHIYRLEQSLSNE